MTRKSDPPPPPWPPQVEPPPDDVDHVRGDPWSWGPLGRALFALALFALAMGGLGIIGWAAQRFPDGSLPQILICFSPAFMALIAAVVIMSGGDPPRRIFPPPVPPPQLVTDFMVDRAMEQGRVDSSLTMVPRVRIERMLRAALSGKVNRKNFNGSL